MRSISIDVDIDIDEILWNLGSRDQKELLERLLDLMNSKDVLNIIRSHENYTDMTNQVRTALVGDDASFTYACAKINSNRWRLPLEQEQLILQIADKL
jgi:hypothetical protein